MKISYYAVFNYREYDDNQEKYGISIYFPGIPIAYTCARNDEEGINMALDVLQLSLINDDGTWPAEDQLPKYTPLEQIKLKPYEKAVLIQFNTEDVDLNEFQSFRNNN